MDFLHLGHLDLRRAYRSSLFAHPCVLATPGFPDVVPTFQQMRCEAVTKGMTSHPLGIMLEPNGILHLV